MKGSWALQAVRDSATKTRLWIRMSVLIGMGGFALAAGLIAAATCVEPGSDDVQPASSITYRIHRAKPDAEHLGFGPRAGYGAGDAGGPSEPSAASDAADPSVVSSAISRPHPDY